MEDGFEFDTLWLQRFLLAFIKTIGLDLFLRIFMTFFCYGIVGLAMEFRLCLQIDEEEEGQF